jgi:hypothetical protein
MRFNINPVLGVLIGTNVICTGLVASLVVYQKVISDGAIAARAKGLETIAQHVKAKTCWSDSSEEPFKLGDEIITKGSKNGKIPTGCIYAPKVEQFLQVAYSNGVLAVVQVYSRQEVKNQLSIPKGENGNGNR